jgi:hypothetical protein
VLQKPRDRGGLLRTTRKLSEHQTAAIQFLRALRRYHLTQLQATTKLRIGNHHWIATKHPLGIPEAQQVATTGHVSNLEALDQVSASLVQQCSHRHQIQCPIG